MNSFEEITRGRSDFSDDQFRYERRVFEHTLQQIAKNKKQESHPLRRLKQYTSNLQYTKALHHEITGQSSEVFDRKKLKPSQTADIEDLDKVEHISQTYQTNPINSSNKKGVGAKQNTGYLSLDSEMRFNSQPINTEETKMKTEEQTEQGQDLHSDRHLTFTKPDKIIGRVCSTRNMMHDSSFLTSKQLRKVGSFTPQVPTSKLSQDAMPSIRSGGWDIEFKLDIEGNEEEQATKEDLGPSRESVKSRDRSNVVKQTIINIPDFQQENYLRHSPFTKEKNEIRLLHRYTYCLILPNDKWKVGWDFFISILIITTAIYTPYRLAFVQSDSTGWMIAELIVDSFFLLDIIFSFFSAYFDDFDNLIDRRRTIICNYLKLWFIIDVVSIIPISVILNLTNSSVNNLARVARISRMYKLIKMLKLLRMMRMVKQRKQFHKYLSYIFKTSISLQRLILFLTVFFILCHVASCLWYLIAKLQDFREDGWVMRSGYYDHSNSDLYLIGFYFTITTITTVGYGDLSAGTFGERIFCICLMIVGVISYSFAISSFTSIITTLDSKMAKLKEKLNTLNNI